MFQVQAPVVIVPSTEARAALGVQLRPAALAAWLRDRPPRQGHRDGAFPDRPYGRDAGGVLAPPPRRLHRDRAWHRRPEAGCASHSRRATAAGRGSGPGSPAGAPVMEACRGQHRCPRRTRMCIDRRCVPPLVMRLRENPTASSILPCTPSRRPLVARRFVAVRATGTEKPHLRWHASGSDARAAHSLLHPMSGEIDMSAPFERRCAVARGAGRNGASLALHCARNVYAAVDRRARKQGHWRAGSKRTRRGSACRTRLFRTTATGSVLHGAAASRSRIGARSARRWRKPRQACRIRRMRPSIAGLRRSPDVLDLDHWKADILALALHYRLDQRVERLFDTLERVSWWPSRGSTGTLH